MTEKKVLEPGRDKEDVEIIKGMFKDNDALVYAIRKFLLQFRMTDLEKQMVNNLKPEEIAILRKEILPDMEEGPIGSVNDNWGGIEYTHPDMVYPGLLVREKSIDYLFQQLNALGKGTSDGTIKLRQLAVRPSSMSPLDAFISHAARQGCKNQVDRNLMSLFLVANQESKTVKELIEQRKKDSTR